jgi:uncharacterized protein (UPF0210 family)
MAQPDTPRPVIRTLTLGLADPHPLSRPVVAATASRLHRMADAFRAAGYEVQTVRVSTRPAFDAFPDLSDNLVRYARKLQSYVDDAGIDQLSLGPAPAVRPSFPLDRLAVIEDLLAGADRLSCAVHLAAAAQGIRTDAALPIARTMLRIAEHTEAGSGNFRFAALARVRVGHPFFPASYHGGPAALTIGLQSAGVVAAAIGSGKALDPPAITARVRRCLVDAATPVVELGQRLAAEVGLAFGGIDLSPAPSVQESIGEAVELGIGSRFGAPGTVAVAAAITQGLRSTGLPACGYNGLMLPVMEDPVLAREWSAGRLTVHQLLCYSAVCGTGLDTVPLPGDTSAEEIAALLLDVATLATRLDKPLSARLFPVPGKGAGDTTEFTSPYLVNLRLPGPAGH